MTINEICRRKRREMDLTQSRLAEYVGVTKGQISHFELGRSGVSSKTLEKIIDVLGLELN